MPYFNNLKDLENYLSRHIKHALQDVALEIEKVLKDYIIEHWYNRPDFTPNDSKYTRTYDYLNSITVSKVKEIAKGEFAVEIYFDTDKIRPQAPDGRGRWSRHSSITSYGDDKTPDNMGYMIPIWIEEGQNSHLYSYEGVAPVANTVKLIEEVGLHVKAIMGILKSKGINVSIK